jgi:hypothetical protein
VENVLGIQVRRRLAKPMVFGPRGFKSHPRRFPTNPLHSQALGEILSFGLWMNKQGYRHSTVHYCVQALKSIARQTSLLDPESVKTFLKRIKTLDKTLTALRKSYNAQLTLYVGVPPLTAGIVTIVMLTALNVHPNQDYLKTLVESTAQLLGLVGIILSIFYPVQRSLIGDIRNEKARWLQIKNRFDALKREEQEEILNSIPLTYFKTSIRKQFFKTIIYDLDKEILVSQSSYASVLGGLIFSFCVVAVDLVIELIHLSMSDPLFTLNGGILPLGVELTFVEILLLVADIASLILVLARAANRAFRSFRIVRAPEDVYNVVVSRLDTDQWRHCSEFESVRVTFDRDRPLFIAQPVYDCRG